MRRICAFFTDNIGVVSGLILVAIMAISAGSDPIISAALFRKAVMWIQTSCGGSGFKKGQWLVQKGPPCPLGHGKGPAPSLLVALFGIFLMGALLGHLIVKSF